MPKKNVSADVAENVKETHLQFDEDLCHKIRVIRGCQVILDRDIADLYGVETKRINEQVKRNANRFPEEFVIRLNRIEFEELVANCDRFGMLKHFSSLPYAFTEQGVAMLSAVLKSDNAVRVSIAIMKAFVAMRHFLMENQSFLGDNGILQLSLQTSRNSQKIDKLEKNVKTVMEYFHDQSTYKHHLILDGQKLEADVAYTQIYGLAERSIFVIDNYVGVKITTITQLECPEVYHALIDGML